MASKFNADAFLNQTVEQVLDTKRIPFPEGERDDLVVRDVSINSGTNKSGDNAGKPWVRLKVKVSTTDANVAEEMNLDEGQEPIVYWDEFLDLDDNGQLAVGAGKNVKLGKLRHACGQNTDEAWTIRDLVGAVLGGEISHRLTQEGDPYAVLGQVFNPEDEE